MVIERDADDVARCFLLERDDVERRLARAGHDGEVVGVIGAGAFVRFGDGYEGHAAGAPAARRLVGAQRGGHDPGGRPQRRARSVSATRSAWPCSRVEAPRGRVDLDLVGPVEPTTLLGRVAKGEEAKVAPGDVATNRQASFRYELLDKLECGMVLEGTEVKSLRDGTASRSRTATR